jgi:4-hydroxy-tetrahydrodipicolinate synthase
MASNRPYRGAFPVAPTIFDDSGSCIDFMIDAGSRGICILANFSP